MSDFFVIFGDTYLPLSYILCTIIYVRFSLTYLPTQKSDILYERSLSRTGVLDEPNVELKCQSVRRVMVFLASNSLHNLSPENILTCILMLNSNIKQTLPGDFLLMIEAVSLTEIPILKFDDFSLW